MNSRYLPFALLALLSVSGCVDRKAQALRADTAKQVEDQTKLVTVGTPKTETLEETADVSGNITTSQDVQVGFKASGRIVGVAVTDGQSVTQGQVLATLDTATIQAQIAQAQAGVQQARATLAQQQANARLAPGRTIAAVRQAEAAVRSAQAALAKAKTGARPEERRQAEAQVLSAKSDVTTTTRELGRIRTLVAEGALPGNRLDQQQNLVDNAQARLRNATEALAVLTNGARTEDIAIAQEAVRQAQANLANARASRALDTTLADQVNAAAAQVASAQAQLRVQQQALGESVLRAPFSGRVLGKPLQVGSVVSPGSPVLRLIGSGGVYLDGQIPSARSAQIRPGQEVRVSVDALPGKTFTGRVDSIAAQGETTGRTFNARITFASGAAEVRPGMFARGTVILRRVSGAFTLPTSAILVDGTKTYVYLNEGGKAKAADVKTGIVIGDRTQVEGLPPDAPVVLAGAAGLVPGDRLRTKTPAASAQPNR